MIRGTVTPDLEAVISLQVDGPLGRSENVRAVIDSGFNDTLALPPQTVAVLGLPFYMPARFELADGSVVTLDYYEATVHWDGNTSQILVVEADGAPLVGTALLKGYDLAIRMLDGGDVAITAIP